MYDDEFEDLDGELGGMEEDLGKEMRKHAAEEFVSGCYEAYEVLETHGKHALTEAGEEQIKRAINRMTALFILKEEYERCTFLKEFVSKYMPGFKIIPDEAIQKEIQNFI